VGVSLAAAAFFAAFAVFGWYMDRSWSRAFGRGLPPYSGQIKILTSKMLFGESGEGPLVCVIGTMRNDSDVTWKDVKLDVEFLDKEGNVIDVAQGPKVYFTNEVLPRSEGAFKVRAVREFPKEKYVSHRVHVRYASRRSDFP
jgi:hypothetical protein